MEVPWWVPLAVLFILWNDAKASIISQLPKQHQNTEGINVYLSAKAESNTAANIGTSLNTNGLAKPTNSQQLISQGVVKHAAVPANHQSLSKQQFAPNFNTGSSVSQKQISVVQENEARQQAEATISSTTANSQTANSQQVFSQEGVVKQAVVPVNHQRLSRQQFNPNVYPGSTINQRQSSVVQEYESHQQAQAIVSSTSANSQTANSQQFISQQGVVKQAFAPVNHQILSGPQFTQNSNTGSSVSQKQSSGFQNNVNQQQAQAIVSSTSGNSQTANSQELVLKQGVAKEAIVPFNHQKLSTQQFTPKSNRGSSVSQRQSSVIQDNVIQQQAQAIVSSTSANSQTANSQQMISQEVVNQALAPVNYQRLSMQQFTPNGNTGSSVSQKQSSVIQENVSQQQAQTIAPTTTVNSNPYGPWDFVPLLPRSVYAKSGAQATRQPPVQKTNVQQESTVTSSNIATQVENPLILENISNKQTVVTSSAAANRNSVNSQSASVHSNLVLQSPNTKVSSQGTVPKQQILSKSASDSLRPKNTGLILQPTGLNTNSVGHAPNQPSLQNNQLKQQSSISATSSANAQGAVSSTNSVKQANSINSQNGPISLNNKNSINSKETFSTNTQATVAIMDHQNQQNPTNLYQKSNVQQKIASANPNGPVAPGRIISPQFLQFGGHSNLNIAQPTTPNTIKQEERLLNRQVLQDTPSISEKTQLVSSMSNSINSNSEQFFPQRLPVSQKTTSEQSVVTTSNPSNDIPTPRGFLGFPITPTFFSPEAFLPGPISLGYPIPSSQRLMYEPQDSVPYNELTGIPQSTPVSPPCSSVAAPTEQQYITPQRNKVCTESISEINSFTPNTLPSPLNAQQQFSNQVASNTVLTSQISSNMVNTLPSVSKNYALPSTALPGCISSPNILNSNIGSVQTTLSNSNTLAAGISPAGYTAQSITSDLTASTANSPNSNNGPGAISPWLTYLPATAYHYPMENNQFVGNSPLPVGYISQAATLSEMNTPMTYVPNLPSYEAQQDVVSEINQAFPTPNYNTNYISRPASAYFLPTQQSSLRAVNCLEQNTPVNYILNPNSYQLQINPFSSNAQVQSLSSESKISQSNSVNGYSSQSSLHSDISSSVYADAPVDSNFSQISGNTLVPEIETDGVSAIKATQEVSSSPSTNENAISVSSTVTTVEKTVEQSSGDTSAVSPNENIVPESFPKLTFVASAPTIPFSVTPICNPQAPSFASFPPIQPSFQPIIMEESNSRTKNWLPILLASFLSDNGCQVYGGGYCSGSCNCGTQYRTVSNQIPVNNNLNSCSSRQGSTTNCGSNGQSNPVIIIEVDSGDSDKTGTSDSSDNDNTVQDDSPLASEDDIQPAESESL